MTEPQWIVAQTKKESFIESITNIVIGLVIALVAQVAFFQLFNIPISFANNALLVLWMTVVSITRSYLLRRYFNNKQKRKN